MKRLMSGATVAGVLPSVLVRELRALSRRHTAVLGTRSLDILHVAAAIVLGAPAFVTHDDRQAKLARAAGLRVTTHRAGGRRT